MRRENEHFVCADNVCEAVCARTAAAAAYCRFRNRFINDAISSFMFNEETDLTENARSRQNQLIWPPLRHTFQPSCVSLLIHLVILRLRPNDRLSPQPVSLTHCYWWGAYQPLGSRRLISVFITVLCVTISASLVMDVLPLCNPVHKTVDMRGARIRFETNRCLFLWPDYSLISLQDTRPPPPDD